VWKYPIEVLANKLGYCCPPQALTGRNHKNSRTFDPAQ
jgi:hypothetical protein